jgi:iron(III) transport system permease protein
MVINKINTAFILILVALIGLPVWSIFASWVSPNEIFEYFSTSFLISLFSSSAILLFGVGLLSLILGSSLAFLVVFVDFPFKNFFKATLFLPFAIPAYVLGFIYLGVFDYSGYAQTFMREYLGIGGFDLRSSPFAIILTFALAFYPYVYMIAKASFERQNINILQSAKLLGASPFKMFFTVATPLIRPALAAGVLIVLMETLADFGLVSMFNYNTFTLAIYSAWSDFRSIEVASQLSSILMVVAIIFIFLEKKARGGAKYYSYSNNKTTIYIAKNKGKLIVLFPFVVLMLAFVMPIIQLIIWGFDGESVENYLPFLKNSLILILITVAIIIFISLLLNLTKKGVIIDNISKLATIGYALPGSIIAVAILYSTSFIAGENISYLLSGSIILLVFAYTIRFVAIGYNTILSAKQQIKPVFIENAKMLGASRFKTIFQVYLPMLKPGILAASILIAIDVLKELPATYLLRPFDFDTLAIKVYEFSTEGMYETAAIPALFMVLLAIILIMVMQKIEKIK